MNTRYDLDDELIKRGLKKKIKELQEQIEKCKIALRAFGEEPDKTNNQLNLMTEESTKKINFKTVGNKTLRARVESLFNEINRPMTSREIMDKINDLYNKSYNINGFSGNFSQMYRKKTSHIKKYEFDDAPIEIKTVYGLKKWFNGEELKDEYKQRFYEAHPNN